MKGTIFIGGIHGVGKTTASAKLTNHFSVPNFTASNIIKMAESSSLSVHSKQVGDIENNQKLLISGIKNLLEINDVIILDGHFTLLNLASEIEKIKLSVFQDINLTGAILLLEEPLEIYNRLITRDINPLPLNLIEKYQRAEREHAVYVTNALNIPLKFLTNYDDGDLFTVFESLIYHQPRLKHR